MRTKFQRILILSLLLSLSAVAVWGEVTHTVTFSRSLFHISTSTDDDNYNIATYDGLRLTKEEGMPMLPYKLVTLSVPLSSSNFNVQVTRSSVRFYNLDKPLQPGPRVVQDDYSCIVEAAEPDSAVYSAHSYFPSPDAKVVSESFIEGENHVITIAVFPASYNPGSSRMCFSGTMKLKVTYDDTLSWNSLRPVIRRSDLRAEGQEKTRAMVVNPDDVSRFGPAVSAQPMNMPQLQLGNIDYDYLVVASDEYEEPLRRLAALKRQKGYNVRIATLSEIFSDSNAITGDSVAVGNNQLSVISDSAGIIRQYLRNNYSQHKTKYVLFAGMDVPTRNTCGQHVFESYIAYIEYTTDFYFTNLTNVWNFDYFDGEYLYVYIGAHQNIDAGSQLSVGRLRFQNEEQVNDYTRKLFTYELSPGHGDVAYLGKSLNTVGKEWRQGLLDLPDTCFIHTIADTTSLVEFVNYTTGEEIVSNINNNHYGLWNVFNLGEPSSILASGHLPQSPDDDMSHPGPIYHVWALDSIRTTKLGVAETNQNSGLDNLSNKNYPMIIYNEGQTTMPFDVQNGYEHIPMTFGDSFTLGKNYGGPVYLGNTHFGYMSLNHDIHKEFIAGINSSESTLADAMGTARSDFYKNSGANNLLLNEAICVLNLLGDPETRLWKGQPSLFSGISLSRSDNSVTITGLPSTDTTTIAYCDNDGNVGKISAMQNSLVLHGVSPNSCVMVYGMNNIPYIAPLILQNETIDHSQYIIATTVTAGNNVDGNRTNGNVTIANGTTYEIEASGEVLLQGGFNVERGARFHIIPSDY